MDRIKPWHVAVAAAVAVLAGVGAWMALFRGPRDLGVARPPAPEQGVYRLATFNVEGLCDPADDPSLKGENEDTPSSDERLRAIADAIRVIDADILALEDVESGDALAWFRDTYLQGMGYEHIASLDVGHPKGGENAVLSRFPVVASKVWPDLKLGGEHPAEVAGEANPLGGQPLRFRRSPLMVRIDVPGEGSSREEPLTLLVVEQKGGDKFEYWREAEARALVRFAGSAAPGERVILLGSFHAEPGDPSVDLLLEGGFADVFGGEGESKRWVTETSGDRTDLILANRAALADLDPEAGFVLGGPLAKLTRGSLEGADHLPVVVGLPADSR